MIEITNLLFQYAAGPPVFNGFNWKVNPGEAWAVIGPSGCGKSTLLYLIAGLRHPTAGHLAVGGRTLDRPRPETGLILQDYGLLPWATVRQNVELGLRIRRFYGPDGTHTPVGFDAVAGRDRVQQWLERLGIAPQADQYPGQISGGQRQRTAIARTLVLEPDLLLMDEPFSSLDAATREDLQNVVSSLQKETRLAVLIVTHSIEEAVFMGKHILILEAAPNSNTNIIDNPGANEPGYRNSVIYLEQANRIRQMMGMIV
jgi:ABC-type nitrate/sulfonate/bicarbonate transport system ATPase subunit